MTPGVWEEEKQWEDQEEGSTLFFYASSFPPHPHIFPLHFWILGNGRDKKIYVLFIILIWLLNALYMQASKY